MNTDCLFCRIARGEAKADVVYRTPTLVAIRDINPQAPTHVLVIPTEHVETLGDTADAEFLGACWSPPARWRAASGLTCGATGWWINNKAESGQTVPHIHLHVLGGRAMKWPPG